MDTLLPVARLLAIALPAEARNLLTTTRAQLEGGGEAPLRELDAWFLRRVHPASK